MTSKAPVATRTDAVVSNRLFGFMQLLRNHSFHISASEIKTTHLIASHAFIESETLLHHALRSALCQSKAQWLEFSILFKEYWQPKSQAPGEPGNDINSGSTRGAQSSGLSYFSESIAEEQTRTNHTDTLDIHSGGASDAQTLSQRDFRFVFNPRDMRRIELIVDDISRRMQKRMRRRARQHRTRGRLDMRSTARKSLRTNGWPFELRYRRKQKTHARFLLLLDVSQSMEIYSYLFLRFARGILQAFKDTDAYAFHTELIPIGNELKDKSTKRLESKLNDLSSGWLGGTRIAESLHSFNRDHANQKVHKNTIVIIFSDGYDSGDPDQLVNEVQELKAQCRRLVWVNPLLGRSVPGEKPLPIEKSLIAAIPHLDLYTSAHNLVTLRNLESAFKLR